MADQPRADVRAVLDAMEAMDVPDYYDLSPAEAREQRRGLFAADPDGAVDGDARTVPGPSLELPVRVYHPEADGPHPVVVYFHGGGFVLGTLDSHDPVCRGLASEADCVVVSVAYRLAPEHPFPAAVEDAYAATEWVADNAGEVGGDPDRLAVAGDSAGGNLAAAVSLAARDRDGPDIAHQGLVYPVVDHRETDYDSEAENASGYFLEREGMEWFDDRYVDSWVDRANPYLSPIAAASHSDLPPAAVVTCGFDPLRDEGLAYVDRLEEAGVPVMHRHYDDLIHGVMSFVADPVDTDSGHEVLERFAADLRDGVDGA
jgi:acetyl esterase